MGILEWATNPWGRTFRSICMVFIWVSIIAGLLFLIVHATWLRFFAKSRQFASDTSPAIAPKIPKHVPRHSLVARRFTGSWQFDVHSAVTAFLPKVGVQFNWVTYHWIAGAVLTISICSTSFMLLSGWILVDLA